MCGRYEIQLNVRSEGGGGREMYNVDVAKGTRRRYAHSVIHSFIQVFVQPFGCACLRTVGTKLVKTDILFTLKLPSGGEGQGLKK